MMLFLLEPNKHNSTEKELMFPKNMEINEVVVDLTKFPSSDLSPYFDNHYV